MLRRTASGEERPTCRGKASQSGVGCAMGEGLGAGEGAVGRAGEATHLCVEPLLSVLQAHHLAAGERKDFLALSSQGKPLVLFRLSSQQLREHLAQQLPKLLP